MMKKKLLVLVLTLASTCMVQAGWGPGRGMGGGGKAQTLDALSPAEAERLSYLREEEKMARDVYVTLFETWGLFAFDNISQAEQQHMDAVLNMLNRYGLVDPAQTQAGLFTHGELQHLYDNLVTQGRASILQALQTGALIEEVDMQDLDEMIAATENESLISLYETLHCGSRNHLRAFVRQIESRGLVYTAQVMTQDAVDQIADSPMERRCGARF
jgi:hypothetical protein